MSSTAIVQLVATGAQDIYLTGKPQMTYWKTVYRRHTNYATESVQLAITGSIRPGAKVSVTVPKSGDLLRRLWIHYNPSELIPSGGGAPTNVLYICSDLGHALLDKIEIEIEQARHDEEIRKIQENQTQQQTLLTERFTKNPAQITIVLQSRYKLNGN